MDIILFGIQGSGKGTQAQFLAEKYGYIAYSTGEALRENISRDTEIGKKAAYYVNSGILVPDDILIELFEDFFDSIDQTKAVIFDGVPRTEVQVRGFEKIVQKYDRQCSALLIELSEEEAIKRMSLRGRSDDTDMQVIKTRFENFYTKTMPIYEIYERQGNLLKVNGEQTPEKVFADIEKALKLSK